MCAHGSVPRPTWVRVIDVGSIQNARPTMRKTRAIAAPAPILNGRRLMSVMLDLLSGVAYSSRMRLSLGLAVVVLLAPAVAEAKRIPLSLDRASSAAHRAGERFAL